MLPGSAGQMGIHPAGVVESVALRVYRLAPRKARIEVCGTSVSSYLPAYFDRRRWQFDGTALAATDLTGLPESSAAGDHRAPARFGGRC
jgi:hypothetical protein